MKWIRSTKCFGLRSVILCTTVVLIFLFVVGCGANNLAGNKASSAEAEETDGEQNELGEDKPIEKSSSILELEVDKFIPIFEESDESSSQDWFWGRALFETFQFFRRFNDPEDQGVIDTSNFHKIGLEVNNFSSRTAESCSAISEQIITPPFNFGNGQVSYDCAFNKEASSGYNFGGAIKEVYEDDVHVSFYGVYGFVWVDTPKDDSKGHLEFGSAQVSVNNLTDDQSVDFAMWVDYEGGSDYCYRNDIDGNTKTNIFTIRSIKGSLDENMAYISIVGKGRSGGVGHYMLLKVRADNVYDKYFCIKANSGEDDLRAMDPLGSRVVPEKCAEYQEDVDSMIPFTTDDLACESSDFNPGGIGVASEGTIYLNFE